jgi:hypothetical protein
VADLLGWIGCKQQNLPVLNQVGGPCHIVPVADFAVIQTWRRRKIRSPRGPRQSSWR